MTKFDKIMYAIIIVLMLWLAFTLNVMVANQNQIIQDVLEMEQLHRENQEQIRQLEEHIDRLWDHLDQLDPLIEILPLAYTEVIELTAYAPLDPNAVEGMCFSGDPTITASGARSKPGITIAMSRDIPFGTRVYIPGYGWRTVQDRGVGPNRIDLMVQTRAEAFRIGRQRNITVLIVLP